MVLMPRGIPGTSVDVPALVGSLDPLVVMYLGMALVVASGLVALLISYRKG